jgi:hypothetical protein
MTDQILSSKRRTDRDKGKLSGKRHAFQFQTLRFLLSGSTSVGGPPCSVVGGSEVSKFGAPVQNERLDWQSRGMRRFTGKSRQLTTTRCVRDRLPLPEPKNRSATSQASHPAVFFLRCDSWLCATAGEILSRWILLTDLRYLAGQQHASCCTSSEILHTCIIAASSCSMLPKSGCGLVFFAACSTEKQHVTSLACSERRIFPSRPFKGCFRLQSPN